MTDTFSWDVLVYHLSTDPSALAFVAICLGMVAVTYCVLALWLGVTTPKDSPDE